MTWRTRRPARLSGHGFLDGWHLETVADSTLPGCEDAVEGMIGYVPADVSVDICNRDAASLFGHPLPAETLP